MNKGSFLPGRASLRGQLIFSYLALSFLCFTLFIRMYTSSVNAMQEKMQITLDTVAQQLEQQLDERLSQLKTLSEIIHYDRTYQELLSVGSTDYLQQIRSYWEAERGINSMASYFSDLDIEIYLSERSLLASDNSYFFDSTAVRSEGWYQHAVENKGAIYWDMETTYDGDYQRGIPAVSAVVMSNNLYQFVEEPIVVKISLAKRELQEILRKARNGQEMEMYLIDPEGGILSSGGWDQEQSPYAGRLLGDMGNFRQDSEAGEMEGLYRRLGVNGWYALLVVPESYYESRLEGRQQYLLQMLFILGAFVIVANLLVKAIVHRINRISQVLSDIEGQNFQTKLTVDRHDELSRLEEKINEFILQIQELMHGIVRVEQEKRKYEVLTLQSQINPHFIYNTLDSINWLAISRKQYDISETVVNLASFLRLSLSAGRDTVTIESELNHVRMYTRVLQARTDCLLHLEVEVEEALLHEGAVKITLQPFIENAIIHGFLTPGRAEGTIRVRGWKEGENVVLEIADDGVGFDPNGEQGKQSESIGIQNVRDRLRLYFGSKADIQMKSAPGCGTTVRMTWPSFTL